MKKNKIMDYLKMQKGFLCKKINIVNEFNKIISACNGLNKTKVNPTKISVLTIVIMKLTNVNAHALTLTKWGNTSGAFNWDSIYAAFRTWSSNYIFGSFGLIGFSVFVMAGMRIMLSSFARDSSEQYHKAKTGIASFVFGLGVTTFAFGIVSTLSSLF